MENQNYCKRKIIRSDELKENIVKRYLKGESAGKLAKEFNTTDVVIRRWAHKYEDNGLSGLKSETGKKIGYRKGRPKNITTEEERLKREVAKLEIEIARLKKGYLVKGVGAKKEYVTTFEENMK